MTAPAFAAPLGRQPSIEWVPVDHLLIDDSYQRSIDTKASQKLIAAIAARWDWDVLDVLKVSRRPDDRLFVVDGQHRVAGARLRGDIAQLPCVLKRCAGSVDEARLFIASNRGRKPMSRLDDFRAAVGAGDEQAAAIEAMVMAAGLSIARSVTPVSQAPGELMIVAPLRAALALRGPKVVGRALALLGEAFGHETIVGASALFGALVEIVALTDLTDAPILAALRGATSAEWAERGRPGFPGGGRTKLIAMRAAIEQHTRFELTRSPPGSTSSASPPARQPASPPARQPASPPARQPASPPAGGGKRARTFEEQLAAVRAGAKLVEVKPLRRSEPDVTLGGVASGML